MRRVSSCAVLMVSFALLGGCALDPGTSPPRGAPLVLDPAVQRTVLELLGDYRPPAAAASATRVDEVYVRGVGVVHRRVEGDLKRQESGAWAEGVKTSTVERGPQSVGHVLHLCGLITLVSASTTGIVGIREDVFVPFGIHAPFGMGIWTRATKIETSVPNICAPMAGMTFTARASFEGWSKPLYSTVGTIKSPQETVELRCTTASQARPARDLGLPLTGEALHVSCEQLSGATPGEPSEYAFARELGLYMFLSRGRPGDARTIKARFESAAPRP